MNDNSSLPSGIVGTFGSEANAAPISIEQLRVAFENGSPTIVHDSLVPYLSVDYRNNGDAQAVAEISEAVSKLLYPWFQNSEAMRSDEQRSLYMLLRPDGVLIDTLLQYHILQRQRSPKSYGMMVEAQSYPVEYANSKSANLPLELAKRVMHSAGNGGEQSAGFSVNALEYYLYHFCKALVPPRENSTDLASGSIAYPARSTGRSAVKHGAVVTGSVVNSLAREYTCFFLPVSVPEKHSNILGDPRGDRSQIGQIRSRLHELSPKKPQTTLQEDPVDARKPGITDVDLLDSCEYAQTLDLAGYYISCVVMLWLPTITRDLKASIRSTGQKGVNENTSFGELSMGLADSSGGWVWIPSYSHLYALNLFHMVVGYVAKGERQMERYHLNGVIPGFSPLGTSDQTTGHRMANVPEQYAAAFEKRMELSGTLRDTLRMRYLNVPIADTLGLVLACCGCANITDSEVWVPFLDVTASVWIRYIMPWRGSRTDSPGNSGNSSEELSLAWQSRIPLMVKGLSPVLYGQTFAMFLRQISSSHMDMLAHTNRPVDDRQGQHGVQSWIHGAVESVFGHGHVVDALSVLERVVSAFTGTELRAILAAIERFQIEAFPKLRSKLALDPAGLPRMLDGGSSNDIFNTPSKIPRESQLQIQELQQGEAENQVFESLVAAAQQHLAPYISEIVACRSGSAVLDTVIIGSFGSPPVSIVFGRPPSGLLQSSVQALHSAELLAERQLRLIVPERSSDQARSFVSDVFLVISRLFSASDADPGSRPWASGGLDTRDRLGTAGNETMRARAQGLHEAQGRIKTLYGRLAVIFYVSKKRIEEIKATQDDAMFALATGPTSDNGVGMGANGFGQRLAARGRLGEWTGGNGGGIAPEMEHGSLTPRGRWELKTGRKKFTSQSLLATPQTPSTPTSTRHQRMQQTPVYSRQSSLGSPPRWDLDAVVQSTKGVDQGDLDLALLPRGPRAVFEARSYENQWVLDRALRFNVVANEYFQWALDYLESSAYPIPAPLRSYRLDFRWVAAYQNIRFFMLVFLAVWLFRVIFG
ncbi:hypothetical protein GGI07_001576 [Coemansia sp. Benny D115]|nr:hypothetical protein GGI07_001576 [Coemansia sp. Benny D115]